MATQEKVKVTSAGKEVGFAPWTKFDSVEEAIAANGAESVLDRYNAQMRTDAANALREASRPKKSKAALRDKATRRISPNELAAVWGDDAKYETLVQAKLKEVMAEIEAAGGEEEDKD
jgi:hypothetical protein